MNSEASIIYLTNRTKTKLIHYLGEEMKTFILSEGSIAGYVVINNCIQNISNTYYNCFFNGKIDIDTEMPIISMPIKNPHTNEIIGVFEVINGRGIYGSSSFNKSKISDKEYEQLEFFSMQIAQIIINILNSKNLNFIE